MPPEPQSRIPPWVEPVLLLLVRNDQEARGRVKQVTCHTAADVFPHNAGLSIVPIVTKGRKQGKEGLWKRINCDRYGNLASNRFGQIVTFFVSRVACNMNFQNRLDQQRHDQE